MLTPGSPALPALTSEYATDPDMRDLVAEFVDAMPARALALQVALAEQRLRDLQRLAHQLKGAAGGYGFPTLGSAAGILESTLKSPGLKSADPAPLDRIRTQVDDLIALCSRAVAGPR